MATFNRLIRKPYYTKLYLLYNSTHPSFFSISSFHPFPHTYSQFFSRFSSQFPTIRDEVSNSRHWVPPPFQDHVAASEIEHFLPDVIYSPRIDIQRECSPDIIEALHSSRVIDKSCFCHIPTAVTHSKPRFLTLPLPSWFLIKLKILESRIIRFWIVNFWYRILRISRMLETFFET